MYGVPPPNAGDDGGAAGDGYTPMVNQAWKGSNIFILNGRFIFGPDGRSLFLTIFLIAAPVVIFCVFVGRKMMVDFQGRWGTSIVVVAVAFTFYVSTC